MDDKTKAKIVHEIGHCFRSEEIDAILKMTHDNDERQWLIKFHQQLLKDEDAWLNTIDYCAIATSILYTLDDKTWARKLYQIADDKAVLCSEMFEVIEYVIYELKDREWGCKLCNTAIRDWISEDDSEEYFKVAKLVLSPLINNVEWGRRLLTAALDNSIYPPEEADEIQAKLDELGPPDIVDSDKEPVDEHIADNDDNYECGEMEYHIMEYLTADCETVQGFVLLEAEAFKQWWKHKNTGEVKSYAVVNGMETMAEWGMVSCNRMWDYKAEVNNLPGKGIENIEKWVDDNSEPIWEQDEESFVSNQELGRREEAEIRQNFERMFGKAGFAAFLAETMQEQTAEVQSSSSVPLE